MTFWKAARLCNITPVVSERRHDVLRRKLTVLVDLGGPLDVHRARVDGVEPVLGARARVVEEGVTREHEVKKLDPGRVYEDGAGRARLGEHPVLEVLVVRDGDVRDVVVASPPDLRVKSHLLLSRELGEDVGEGTSRETLAVANVSERRVLAAARRDLLVDPVEFSVRELSSADDRSRIVHVDVDESRADGDAVVDRGGNGHRELGKMLFLGRELLHRLGGVCWSVWMCD